MVFILCDLPLILAVSLFLAPGSPPFNITVSAFNSSSVRISWRPPKMPNGVISAYNLHISYMNDSNDEWWTINGTEEEWIVSGLSPYQRVCLSLSASTQAGSGPPCDYVCARSGEKRTRAQ